MRFFNKPAYLLDSRVKIFNGLLHCSILRAI